MLFVVYHKNIYDVGYDKNITYVAVNENIQKGISENYQVIKEWEFKDYDPKYQELGYNENSVIIHLGKNNIHKNYDWIGITQYDIFIPNIPNKVDDDTCYYVCSGFNLMEETIIPINFFFEEYSSYFNEPITFEEFKKICENKMNKLEIPLLNTFLISSNNYDLFYPFWKHIADKLAPIVKRPKTNIMAHHRFIGSIMERYVGMTLILKLNIFKKLEAIFHDFSFDYQNRDKGEIHKTPDEILKKYNL